MNLMTKGIFDLGKLIVAFIAISILAFNIGWAIRASILSEKKRQRKRLGKETLPLIPPAVMYVQNFWVAVFARICKLPTN